MSVGRIQEKEGNEHCSKLGGNVDNQVAKCRALFHMVICGLKCMANNGDFIL